MIKWSENNIFIPWKCCRIWPSNRDCCINISFHNYSISNIPCLSSIAVRIKGTTITLQSIGSINTNNPNSSICNRITSCSVTSSINGCWITSDFSGFLCLPKCSGRTWICCCNSTWATVWSLICFYKGLSWKCFETVSKTSDWTYWIRACFTVGFEDITVSCSDFCCTCWYYNGCKFWVISIW